MKNIKIDSLTDAVMKELNYFKKVTTKDLKEEVKNTANNIKKDISKNAPVKSGKYKKSWATKTIKETDNSLEMVVHSRNKYQLAHLLEFGHALRNGGRTSPKPHIKQAEEKGIKEFEENIQRIIKNG
ncbi:MULTISPECIES: HK97 gp10 family phage protein [Helcococcus]|uniref:HK97 gp10 family phage protein n=1 Tax=Helcococcus bovis TaxID=3153252 RepID=A0ABW9F6K1_9FIRM